MLLSADTMTFLLVNNIKFTVEAG